MHMLVNKASSDCLHARAWPACASLGSSLCHAACSPTPFPSMLFMPPAPLPCCPICVQDGDDPNTVVPSEEAEGECNRKKALVEADPVANLTLSAFAKQQLEVAGGVHGAALNAALNAMDPSMGGQLKTMLDSVK